MHVSTISTIMSRRVSRRAFISGTAAASGLALTGLGGRGVLAEAGPVAGARVTVITDALNVRDAPGLSSNVIGVEYEGATGVMTGNGDSGDGYSWLEVDYDDGLSGWSAASLLEQGGSDQNGAVGPYYPVGTPVTVAVDALNVRDAAGLSSNVIAVVTYGTQGDTYASVVDADGYVWTAVHFPEVSGWVATEFLTAPPGGGGGTSGGGGGSVAIGDTIKVVDGPLNIRSGPGTDYGVIDVAATGAVAQVTDGPHTASGYTWVQIDGNLLAIGWVAYEFCQVI